MYQNQVARAGVILGMVLAGDARRIAASATGSRIAPPAARRPRPSHAHAYGPGGRTLVDSWDLCLPAQSALQYPHSCSWARVRAHARARVAGGVNRRAGAGKARREAWFVVRTPSAPHAYANAKACQRVPEFGSYAVVQNLGHRTLGDVRACRVGRRPRTAALSRAWSRRRTRSSCTRSRCFRCS